jgi:hypothetical protein
MGSIDKFPADDVVQARSFTIGDSLIPTAGSRDVEGPIITSMLWKKDREMMTQ